jgi:hypothetical protein
MDSNSNGSERILGSSCDEDLEEHKQYIKNKIEELKKIGEKDWRFYNPKKYHDQD